MAGSGFGTVFRITTWGESHGKALGVVVDGCPAGIPLSEEDITPYMNRRRPNGSVMSTQRNEEDKVEILSGVFDGKTTGTMSGPGITEILQRATGPGMRITDLTQSTDFAITEAEEDLPEERPPAVWLREQSRRSCCVCLESSATQHLTGWEMFLPGSQRLPKSLSDSAERSRIPSGLLSGARCQVCRPA